MPKISEDAGHPIRIGRSGGGDVIGNGLTDDAGHTIRTGFTVSASGDIIRNGRTLIQGLSTFRPMGRAGKSEFSKELASLTALLPKELTEEGAYKASPLQDDRFLHPEVFPAVTIQMNKQSGTDGKAWGDAWCSYDQQTKLVAKSIEITISDGDHRATKSCDNCDLASTELVGDFIAWAHFDAKAVWTGRDGKDYTITHSADI